MLIYFAVMMTALIGFCGLAVDVGRLELRTTQLQSAADAGALSGAMELNNGNLAWIAAAKSEVTSVESLNDIPSVIPTVQQTASSGPYATDYSAVQVSITQQVSTIFLEILGAGTTSMTASVKAVAIPPPCMYFMSNPGYTNSGYTVGLWIASATLRSSCTMYAKVGVGVDGFGRLYTPETKTSGATGGTLISGIASNPIFYRAPLLPDPLAYVAAPSLGACTFIVRIVLILPTILNPGTYCGGLSVTGTVVTMNPGLYIFTGGVTIQSGAILNGNGVTMYLTKGGIYGYSQFRLQSGATMRVNAPNDTSAGGIPGILLFGDRSWVGSTQDFVFDNCSFQGDGVIYTTNTGVYDVDCNMQGYNYFNMVTANLYMKRSAALPSNNYYAVAGGSPLHNFASLVQ